MQQFSMAENGTEGGSRERELFWGGLFSKPCCVLLSLFATQISPTAALRCFCFARLFDVQVDQIYKQTVLHNHHPFQHRSRMEYVLRNSLSLHCVTFFCRQIQMFSVLH